MALTGRLIGSIYGKNGAALESKSGTPNGRTNYFPNTGNQFYDIPPGTTFNGVTCNSVIEVYPTGLKVDADKYYSVQTAAQLVTGGI